MLLLDLYIIDASDFPTTSSLINLLRRTDSSTRIALKLHIITMCFSCHTEVQSDDPPPSPGSAENGLQDQSQSVNQQAATQSEEGTHQVPTDKKSKRTSVWVPFVKPIARYIGSKDLEPA